MNLLKEMVATVRHNVRIMVLDVDRLDALEALLDRLVAVSQFNPDEALEVARLVRNDILAYGRNADCSGESEDMAVTFVTDIRAWYGPAKEADRACRRAWGGMGEEAECHGRWESRGGKYWVELWGGWDGWSYRGKSQGGNVCRPNLPVDGALTVILSMLARGRFLPDNAKVGMKRVK